MSRSAIALAASLCLILWTLSDFFAGGVPLPSRGARPGATDPLSLLGDNPIKVPFEPVRVDVPYRPDDLAPYARWISEPVDGEAEQRARSRTLHASRFPERLGVDEKWLERDEKVRVTRVRLPKQAFQRSWRGLEVTETEQGRSTEHRDQLLSALAECGVPLNAVVETDEGPFPIRELLRTSLNEFQKDQKEISWTASALVCYLPPQSTWKNRCGETFSFGDLVDEIMRRPLGQESCSGVHMVMTLTKILRVDREMRFLDPPVRQRLESYLRLRVAEAVGSQLSDGSWPMWWSTTGFRGVAFTPAATEVGRMTVAGHLLEWFHLLPEDLKPPAPTVRAAALWVWSHLQSASRATIVEEFCPYTHAVVALELAAPRQGS